MRWPDAEVEAMVPDITSLGRTLQGAGEGQGRAGAGGQQTAPGGSCSSVCV